MPSVTASELDQGRPFMLVQFGQRHSIGWQGNKRAGPGFVVLKVSRLDTTRVVERFPLTEDGWTQAWQALLRRDPGAAEVAAARLEARAAADRTRARQAKLDADSLVSLRGVTFLGGYTTGAQFINGHAYDLRFLADRLLVCLPGSADPLADLPYAGIAVVDIGGPGQVKRWSVGQQVGLTLAFGLPGAVAGIGSTSIQTVVRIEAADCEISFLHTEKLADALRAELAVPLKAISDARPRPGAGTPGSQPAPESITDQLARLADMMEKGLLTGDEFDLLKARIIAGS